MPFIFLFDSSNCNPHGAVLQNRCVKRPAVAYLNPEWMSNHLINTVISRTFITATRLYGKNSSAFACGSGSSHRAFSETQPLSPFHQSPHLISHLLLQKHLHLPRYPQLQFLLGT
mmetsp:Transcript_5196/g.19459  ORF Transcript_5196/g.19459 Transcript_5196/m.19459 type:complete len:115 (+) Transcript_5196:2494-2838(+)